MLTVDMLRSMFKDRFKGQEPDAAHLELLSDVVDRDQRLALIEVDRQSWLGNRSKLREENENLRGYLKAAAPLIHDETLRQKIESDQDDD